MTNHEKVRTRSGDDVDLAPQEKAVGSEAETAPVVVIADVGKDSNTTPKPMAERTAAGGRTPDYQIAHCWVDTETRRPTVADADSCGNVLAWHCEGYATTVGIEFITSAFIEYTHWQTLDAGPDAFPKPFRRTAGIDIEQMLRDCVPGGHSVDPQIVCDSIRAWFDDHSEAVAR
ncbi:hypothetical protein [Burkholderia gladioli]|uniref:hypothetical protein n=1 Tax=Burkholderia gladioli TaxID=28095 RepID=UPI0012D9DC82|nr:hypothetical protein [Burkholderia gladioli]